MNRIFKVNIIDIEQVAQVPRSVSHAILFLLCKMHQGICFIAIKKHINNGKGGQVYINDDLLYGV